MKKKKYISLSLVIMFLLGLLLFFFAYDLVFWLHGFEPDLFFFTLEFLPVEWQAWILGFSGLIMVIFSSIVGVIYLSISLYVFIRRIIKSF